MPRSILALLVGSLVTVLATPSPAMAQLGNAVVIPAAAHSAGVGGTFWATDLTLHNPQLAPLRVRIQLLPSERVNWEVPTLDLEIGAWETWNLWDALGPDWFDESGTGAVLVFTDPDAVCEPVASCDLLASSRTWTPDRSGRGEYGQTVPGFGLDAGTDWATFAYAAGVHNDGDAFRTNIGVASWTDGETVVRFDVQDELGTVVASQELDIPPFGHVQQRLSGAVFGGTLVAYLVAGPQGALVYPYASVVNQETGDASFVLAQPSAAPTTAGLAHDPAPARRPVPGVSRHVVAPPGAGGGGRLSR